MFTGKVLEYKFIRKSHRNGEMKQYRSSSKDCSACPLRSQCIGKSLFKTIAVTVDKELFEKMHNRLQTPMAKRMKKLRSSTVEPVLGTLVNFLGMRRVNTKGVSLAGKCMTMAAIAYNLKKLMRWQSKKIQADIRGLRFTCNFLLFGLINTIKCYYPLI